MYIFLSNASAQESHKCMYVTYLNTVASVNIYLTYILHTTQYDIIVFMCSYT